jgi:hypothetical protein
VSSSVPPSHSFPIKPHRDHHIFPIVPNTVNSATVGILRRFIGSGDPLAPSLLLKNPWCVVSLTDLSFYTGNHRSCPIVRRRSPHRPPFATTPSVTRLGEPQLPCPCPAVYPIPTGALGEDLAAPRPPAHRRESRHHVSSGSGDRPERTPSAPRRHGLAGPHWSWQSGPVPIWPSELSGLPKREHRMPWAECEVQYCAAVLIFFNLF